MCRGKQFFARFMHFNSLLNRTWYIIVTSCVLIFITFETCIQIDQLNSSAPICNAKKFSTWTNIVKYVEGGCFLAAFIIHFCGLLSSQSSLSALGSTLSIGVVSFLSCAASFMTVGWDWGGVCRDAFGYITYHTTFC